MKRAGMFLFAAAVAAAGIAFLVQWEKAKPNIEAFRKFADTYVQDQQRQIQDSLMTARPNDRVELHLTDVDIRKTDSLVNPIVGTISYTETIRSGDATTVVARNATFTPDDNGGWIPLR